MSDLASKPVPTEWTATIPLRCAMSHTTYTDVVANIEDFEAFGAPFLEGILGLIWHETLLTDETTLADFTGEGLPLEIQKQAATPQELDALWNQWVIVRIEEMFGMAPESTSVRLVELFTQLESAYGGKDAWSDA